MALVVWWICWGTTSLLVAAVFAPAELDEHHGGAEYLPRCAFRALIGRDCPTCGLTRAHAHLWRGEWEAARDRHPAAPFSFVFALGGLAGGPFLLRRQWSRLPHNRASD